MHLFGGKRDVLAKGYAPTASESERILCIHRNNLSLGKQNAAVLETIDYPPSEPRVEIVMRISCVLPSSERGMKSSVNSSPSIVI